jgi:ribonuclease E
MTKRMLIDATHAEETRVVVLDGNRLEDFDVETSTKKQLKGNIYLAKVVRVEPSLQAAFVEYGGGRHGFLAFSEIHPDYYQIPVADRQRLLELQAEEAREEAEAEEAAEAAGLPIAESAGAESASAEAGSAGVQARPVEAAPPIIAVLEATPEPLPASATEAATEPSEAPSESEPPAAVPVEDAAPAPAGPPEHEPPGPAQPAAIEREERFGPIADDLGVEPATDADAAEPGGTEPSEAESETEGEAESETEGETESETEGEADMPPPETVGGESDSSEAAEEARTRRAYRFLRNYRIQEVIRRRQIMLVQVVKEERGTKGAALTTYISLAGRYCVLMPNSPRGGGISRKITSAADRRRLKEITAELDIPPGMGLIVRTAGANRPKAEIKRDCEYLMRLWDDIRELTLRSVAPALIYEEASLIKRAIRDVYSRDIDEVIVDGEEGWRAAHEFMRMLMPSHARKVQLWRGNGQPLFAKYQVEAQLDAMLLPTVQLRSGGYLVINQTEALVAIDVNSGRSTRERGIEETALRTNLEAADEIARQLRLRDLAGLIVIDFIDMDARKHNAMVERRLKEALKADRARIQVGHISHFGLLEMSRQRLRPSLTETNFSPCPHCGGTGHVRSVESSAIHVLRAIEEEGAKGRASAIRVQVAGSIALYLLNHKRDRLAEIEARYAMHVTFEPDESLVPPQIRIERLRPQTQEAIRPALAAPVAPVPPPDVEEETEAEEDAEAGETATAPAATAGEGRPAGEETERRRRRRRRRRGVRREAPVAEAEIPAPSVAEEEAEPTEAEAEAPVDLAQAEQPSVDAAELEEAGMSRGRRRGRRGGRRRAGGESGTEAVPAGLAPQPYLGPTPADPFGSGALDLFEMMDEEVVPGPAPAEPAPPLRAPAEVEMAMEAEMGGEAEAEAPLSAEPAGTGEPVPAPAEPPPEPPPGPPPPAPAIQPIVIADEAPAAERKRGWWRR